jgi:hypothetical protein
MWFVFFLACNGDGKRVKDSGGLDTGSACAPATTWSVGRDDDSGFGVPVSQIVALAEGERTGSVMLSGADTAVPLTVTTTLDDTAFELTRQAGCAYMLSLPGVVTAATADGALDETIDSGVGARSADAVVFSTHLYDGLAGSLDETAALGSGWEAERSQLFNVWESAGLRGYVCRRRVDERGEHREYDLLAVWPEDGEPCSELQEG